LGLNRNEGSILENIASESQLFEDFPSATLYLDDLSEIFGILAEACDKVEVTAGDYEICDPDELDALASKFPQGRFGHIHLQGYDPYIAIDLRTSGVSANISKDTFEQRGLVSKLRDIVQRGKKRNLHPGWLFTGLSHISILGFAWQLFSKEYLMGALLFSLSIASLWISVRYNMKNKVIVHSQRRGSVRTFFERKKDDIALSFIAALFGGAITYLITKLFP
jgi:hypothetical protein